MSGISTRALARDILSLLDLDAEPRGSVTGAGLQDRAVQAVEEPAPTPAPLSTPTTVPQAASPVPAVETPLVAPGTAPSAPPVAVSTKTGMDYTVLDHQKLTPLQRVVRVAANAAFGFLARVETEGLENIPAVGPCVLAVNHLSMAEGPLYLTLLKRRAIPVVSARLQKYLFLHWFVSGVGQAIYVVPDQMNEESLQRALVVLKAGGMLIVAPEGTRSKTGGLMRGKPGVVWLATQIDVPVMPVAAWGQEKWRERVRRFGRIPIHVRAGAPLRFPQGLPSPETMRRDTDRIMAQLAALLPPEYRGVYANQDEFRAA